MTTTATLIGASSSSSWHNAINWPVATKYVQQLQMRIAKAAREERWGKVKALQWLLTHSYAAKLLAVKRVTSNTGRKTPGVDGVIWKTTSQKLEAARSLQRRGYRPLPLRRIYIPKKNGKLRPLGIPSMADRAMQALHLLALEPVAESLADLNSYGFRPYRSTADAIEQCFIALAKKHSPQWILEADIKACFDRINHSWLNSHVLVDKSVLKKWLAVGYMEEGTLYPTKAGTPQGGIISPVLANLALDGIERTAREAAGPNQMIHVIRYADDFIITGATKEVLETKVKPAVVAFLNERGLELSEEKTHITHISNGFDFLGHNVRKYKGKLLIKPAKKAVKRFLADIRRCIKANRATKTVELIHKLNRKIRGWAYYYRHVVAKDTFNRVDGEIFQAMRRWIKRRHPNRPKKWWKQRYFRAEGLRNWVFSAKSRDKLNKHAYVDLFLAASVPIARHIKIRAAATPYDPVFIDYFVCRAKSRRTNSHIWAGMAAFTHEVRNQINTVK